MEYGNRFSTRDCYRLYQMLNPANGIKRKRTQENFYTTLILLAISDFIMILDLFLSV